MTVLIGFQIVGILIELLCTNELERNAAPRCEKYTIVSTVDTATFHSDFIASLI